ncbi:MAG: hypothetical protein J1F60_08735 [Oscillospiraceae bacterium]|nr:hypothetical protein [Oscillospiraceae bacterium]
MPRSAELPLFGLEQAGGEERRCGGEAAFFGGAEKATICEANRWVGREAPNRGFAAPQRSAKAPLTDSSAGAELHERGSPFSLSSYPLFSDQLLDKTEKPC